MSTRTLTITLAGGAMLLAGCNLADRFVQGPAEPTIGPAVTVTPARQPLPNSCQWVTKLDADGVVRARWEDGRMRPCDPNDFDPWAPSK